MVSRSFSVASTFAVAVLQASATFQNCVYPDGTTLAPDTPCNQSAIDAGGHSPCCNLNTLCLDNGLCLGEGILSRGSCTDAKWGPSCTPYCKDNPSGGNPLTPCDPSDGPLFACGWNTTACQTGIGLFTLQGGNAVVLRDFQVAALENGSSAAMLVGADTILQPANSSSIMQAANNCSIMQPANNGSIDTAAAAAPARTFSTGAVVGAALGVGLPLLLALAACIFIIANLQRKLRIAQAAVSSVSETKPEQPGYRNDQASFTQASVRPYFPPAQRAAAKVSQNPQRYGIFREMDGDESAIVEVGVERPVLEMDAATGRK